MLIPIFKQNNKIDRPEACTDCSFHSHLHREDPAKIAITVISLTLCFDPCYQATIRQGESLGIYI